MLSWTSGEPAKPQLGMRAFVSSAAFFDHCTLPVAASKQKTCPQRLNVYTRSPSTAGVEVGRPSNRFGSSADLYVCDQSFLPVAASRQTTVSWSSSLPIVYSRPLLTETAEKPVPTDAFQRMGGPSLGH